jgi:hypothetical protein
MRAFVIWLFVVAATPALCQSQVEKIIEAEKTECLNREVGHLMQLHKTYSLGLVAEIAREAAHICRGKYPFDDRLGQRAYEIAYSLLPADQKKILKEQSERLFKTPSKEERFERLFKTPSKSPGKLN